MEKFLFETFFDHQHQVPTDPNEVAIYNQYQWDEMMNNAYQEGYQAAKEKFQEEATALLHQINQSLITLLQNQKERQQESIAISHLLIQKIFPLLCQTPGWLDFIENIKRTVSQVPSQEMIKVYINPNFENHVKEVLKKSEFYNNVTVHVDSTLDPLDFRVDWGKGGIERCHDLIQKEIEIFLANNQEFWKLQQNNVSFAKDQLKENVEISEEQQGHPEEIVSNEQQTQ